MGLRKVSSERKTYVNVQWGKLRIRTNEHNPEAVKRVDKTGKDVYEELFEELDGFITEMSYDKSKVGSFEYESLEIGIQDADGEKFHVKVLWGSKACKSFLARAESIDFTQPVTLAVFEVAQENDKSKFDTYLTPKQHGQKIEPNYGFNTENPWPKPKVVRVSGKDVNDYSEQLEEMQSILARVQVKIQQEVSNGIPAKLPPSESRFDEPTAKPGNQTNVVDDFPPAPTVPPADEEDYSDDLPF